MDDLSSIPPEELRTELLAKKREFAESKLKISTIAREKECSYQQLHSLRNMLREKFNQITVLKGQRDALTTTVRSLKEERTKHNAEVKEKATIHQEAIEKKRNLSELDMKESTGKLRAQIKFLERKLETEVMPFSKEQEINKKSKELKIKLKELELVRTVAQELKTASSGFMEKKRLAEQSHHDLQQKARESQEKHTALVALYNEVSALREKEKDLAEKCSKLKSSFEKTKQFLQEIEQRIKELSTIIMGEEGKSFREQVKERTAQVMVKMKTGKKLNIDDILAFQALKE